LEYENAKIDATSICRNKKTEGKKVNWLLCIAKKAAMKLFLVCRGS
jgi:hypothetical protein